MNKQIIFSLLLIISTEIYATETPQPIATETALYKPDITWCITKYLCMNHRKDPHNLKYDIRALYETNTFFHDYYSQEKTMQHIITTCEPIYYSGSHGIVTRVLGCRTIQKKINHFAKIARSKETPFTENDLQDSWYFNFNLKPDAQSLLYITIQSLQLDKAHQLITHAKKIDFGWYERNYLLKLIAEHRTTHKKNLNAICTEKNLFNELLSLTERLLREKNMPADGPLPLTALMHTVIYEDKELACLLLNYGANPYKKRGDVLWGKNSFEYAEGKTKSWLKARVKANNLLKYWSLCNYTYNTLPNNIMVLIIRYMQQLHFHANNKNNPLLRIINERSKIKIALKDNAHYDSYGNNAFFFSSKTLDYNDLFKNNTELNDLFEKARRLLQKNFIPDFCEKGTEITPLISAVEHEDRELTQLLLHYDADPYKGKYDSFTKKIKNAFSSAKNNLWFVTMVKDEFQKKNLYKYWLFKNYTGDSRSKLLSELELLILNKLIKITQSQIDQYAVK